MIRRLLIGCLYLGLWVLLEVEEIFGRVCGFLSLSIEVCLAREYSGQEMSVGLDGSHQPAGIKIGGF